VAADKSGAAFASRGPGRFSQLAISAGIVLFACALGFGIMHARDLHLGVTSLPAASLRPTPSPTSTPAPVAESARALAACEGYVPTSGLSPESYLVGAFDSTSEKLTAWGRRLLPGLGSQPLPWQPFPAGTYVAICIYGNPSGFADTRPVDSPAPTRVAVAIGADGTATQITLGNETSLPAVNPAP
jgi:hypothetical protein